VRHHHHHHHHNSNTKEEEKGLSQASRRYSYNNNTGESSWLDASTCSDEEDNENANPTESTDSSYRSSDRSRSVSLATYLLSASYKKVAIHQSYSVRLVSTGSAALEKLKLLSDREGIADQVKGRLQLLNEAKSRMLTARNRHRKLRRALAAVSQNDAQTNHLEHAEHLETAAILLLKKSDTLTQHVEMLLQQKRDNALQSEKIESMGERCASTLELSIKMHYIEHMLRSFKRTKELKAALDKIAGLLIERDRIHCEMEDVEDQIAQVQRRLKIAGQRKEFP